MDAHGHVSPEEVRAALRSMYREDHESNLQKIMLRWLADDLKPVDEKGHWKPSPLAVLIAGLLFAAAVVFICFSLGGQR